MIGYQVDFAPTTLQGSHDARAAYLCRLAQRTAHLPGAIVECGLGNGFSFGHLAREGYRSGKHLYGFDSFEGFPAPSREDVSSYAVKQGDWGHVDLTMVEEKILAQVPREYYESHITIVPGFFDAAIPRADISTISFLHLDGDLYQSYIDCLEALYDKVVPGGIIALDECVNGIEYAKYPGGFTATTRFFEGKDVDLCRDMVTGKYYILKRSA